MPLNVPQLITKYSGDIEEFELSKFTRSLQHSRASTATIAQICQELEKLKPTSTQQIYDYTLKRLIALDRPAAARYNLKHALLELGPAGFPFEKFIAHILHFQGYQVQTGVIVAGMCVNHEIDVLATKDGKNYLGECKFHNSLGLKSDVKITLYIQARFEDIQKATERNKKEGHLFDQPWLITNTKFTLDAIAYAQCVNMRLTSWSYPADHSLAHIIDTLKLYPVTTLTTLNFDQKKLLISNNLILCRDLVHNQKTLKDLNFSDAHIQEIIAEAQAVNA